MSKIAFVIFLFTVPAHAGFFVGPGETGLNFLKVPTSARAVALSGAFTAVQQDAGTVEHNPAGVATLNRADINLAHLIYFEDTKLNSVSIGYPLSTINPKSKWVLGLHYRLFQNEDDARNELGVKLEEFKTRDQAFQLSIAKEWKRLAVGAAGRHITSKLENEHLSAMAFDAGAQIKMTNQLTFGAALLQIGPSNTYASEADPLPTVLRTGAAYKYAKVLLLADLSQSRDAVTRAALGAEWHPTRLLKIRGGLAHQTVLEFSGGLGFMFSDHSNQANENRNTLPNRSISIRDPQSAASPVDLGLDYAIRHHVDLGLTHTLTFRILY